MDKFPKNLKELKSSNWKSRTVKEEIRDNLVKQLQKKKKKIFPEIFGYEDSVEKQIINAILCKHNFILLGLRGQGKTKIIRSLIYFLDNFAPAIDGTLLNEDPFCPISPKGKKIILQMGDDTPIKWISREKRFNEKLATPDVSIADLIGDIDPIKAAREKLDISNEEIIHWGIIPRSNRGIFSINELPDLQPRIQVGLFNILEEKDIQVRGFPLRLPLDILLVFSANPEDYTNRGRIITPLKDRIDSQIITHYPRNIETAKQITKSQVDQEILKKNDSPPLLMTIVEYLAILARKSEMTDSMSGVSQRLVISALENILANAERRKIFYKQKKTKLRVMDLYAAVSAITGKVELIEEKNSEEIEQLATVLISKSIESSLAKIIPKIFETSLKKNKHLPEEDEDANYSLPEYESIISFFKDGNEINLSESMDDKEYFDTLDKVPGLQKFTLKYFNDHEYICFYMEAVLEFIYCNSYISRKVKNGMITFVDLYSSMFKKV